MAKKTDFTTVKVSVEAVRIGKIAAAHKGMNLSEFVSWLIQDQAPRIIAEGAAGLAEEAKKKGRK